jgi:hypothetical protein
MTAERGSARGGSFIALSTLVENPGATITVRQTVDTNGGSHGAEARLEVLAIVRRTT